MSLAAKLAEGNRGVVLAPRSGASELVLWIGAGFGLLPNAAQRRRMSQYYDAL